MKIYNQGRLVNGRFTSLKSALKRLIRGLIRLFVFGAIFIGSAAYIGAQFFSDTVIATNEVSVDRTQERIEVLKDDLVERLAAECESKGYKDEDGIIILDTNDEVSIGRWQWQRDSVIHYYKTLYGENITRKDATLVALDDAKARALTKDVLFKVKDGSDNWHNCSKKLNLPTEIALIKKIEQ